MNKFITEITKLGSLENLIVILILFVNIILMFLPVKIRRSLLFDIAITNFSKYSYIVCATCLVIIIISIIRFKINREKSKRNKKYFS